ncbi:cell division protein FtsQ/DivIB [Photobacterium sp. WH77]|uniref:cell division protein FtsQ/DivIB n=1 Tax=Photobacterium TaxID=657 RepID=UPI001C47DB7C|nr:MULTISPECIES: cell division protein FtsQ/DivIB [Photobacterium]MBV7262006.1 cell division protein FtsQ/DivIB [Photobacterium sp. WH24]MCG2836602.1 cell division protein FtsQ/DivIB [Photobacterium sp. WH77]MCG2844271.1 cell division protein FtsQ/DivIB [Photobacterium sp. WH80]MDO6581981.1 cell division protein FtsQ/DivIB [Photobacterium sp. 2_MG-2023]
MTETALKQSNLIGSTLSQWRGLSFLVLVITAMAWLFVAVVHWMTDANRLPLSQLIIQGELHHLTTDQVRQGILEMGSLGSFMLQDVDELQHALESLPWVAQASVRKQWPDTVKVYLVEHQPAAVWNDKYLVNLQGQVFHAPSSDVSGEPMVTLEGPDGSSEEMLKTWREMQPELQRGGLEIVRLSLNERRSWRIWLSNGIRLELGREARIERIKRFLWLYPDLEQQGKAVDYVDLRYDTGVAVGWQQNNE